MKILQINSVVNIGSTGRIAEQIGKLIIEEGWESVIAFGRDARPSSSRIYKVGTIFDVLIHGLNSFFRGQHGLSSTRPTIKLIEFIKSEQIDIVHLHNIHGYYLNIKVFFEELSKLNVKIVWTFHDCWAFTGHCTYFSNINCEKWKTKCFDCPKKRYYPKSLFVDSSEFFYELKNYLFNLNNIHIVTVSSWLESLVKESFLNKHAITNIKNGVDEHKFIIQNKNSNLLKQYHLEGKSVLLAASTSWAKRKGFSDYLKLSKILKDNSIIVLIGLPSTYKKLLPSNIVGISKTDNIQKLASWYATADIVLNLSYQESFGLTSIEGFMCGKPSVVYNTTASPELIVEPELGLVVPPGDIDAVKRAIDEILKLKIDESRIRNIALSKFSARRQFTKYIDLYKVISKN